MIPCVCNNFVTWNYFHFHAVKLTSRVNHLNVVEGVNLESPAVMPGMNQVWTLAISSYLLVNPKIEETEKMNCMAV